ncbi:P-type ATPase [Schizosaccharomyces japonicus yFS275]|uniref:Calcium-transporting ATPase n=1 Tax=Schizosaccharomyces japonicus (strain yFS275 / FY16936) TaxID=402676 RepID=B6K581_SCHJY|nr:P-type ATPase [Schizosaccharomyces japonicus yFS275]EEB08685.1 P-type ATPase [Schizosaccharomyces japonicus yFS275]
MSSQYAAFSTEQTCADLETDAVNGLTSISSISQRKLVHGENILSSDEEDSLIRQFLKQFVSDPLILLLFGSAAISLLLGNVSDAISIALAIFIVVTVGFVQEYRSEKSLQALNNLVPHNCTVIRFGKEQLINATGLVPGDLVRLEIGDRVPADLRLTDAIDLEIDESNLTGETTPRSKTTKTQPNAVSLAVNERRNTAFMGTLVRHGRGKGIVVATGKDTEFGQVFLTMQETEKPKTPLQRSMDQLGKHLSMISFAIIAVIVLIGFVQGKRWLEMLTIGVSLAVAAIPEGLPIIVTVTLALGVLRMSKNRAIVRRLPSVETLGSVNVVCSDKTGTLTMNHMTVGKIYIPGMKFVYTLPDSSVEKIASSNLGFEKLLLAAFLCNNSKLRDQKAHSMFESGYVGLPVDVALAECASRFGMQDPRNSYPRLSEVPFSSDRKFMSVVVQHAHQKLCCMKGATEYVLGQCVSYVTEGGLVLDMTETMRNEIFEREREMASTGLRIIAVASGTSFEKLAFHGLFGINDPPRENVHESIKCLLASGVRVVMITGDSIVTALSIARTLGLPLPNSDEDASGTYALTGEQLDALSPAALRELVPQVSVFARTTPQHKMKIVSALQSHGDVVAMTGDGVNDAPALKLADIGIAMGRQGTDVAKEAADMILTDDSFATILAAIEEGKGIYNNIRNFITFQLSTSVAALSLIAIASLFHWQNPLNAMQILWINILMDGPPAQSLGVEPVDDDVMEKPPRPRNAPIITTHLLRRVLLSAFLIVVGTVFTFKLQMRDGVVTARDTTMTFTCFVFFDMFNALGCRSETKSVFELGMFSNRMFNIAVGGSLIGQALVIYFPPFQAIFQTEPLAFKDLVVLAVLASSVFWLDEFIKWYRRERGLTHSKSTYLLRHV